MTADRAIRPVLAHYPADCQPSSVEDLASAGGFSGARLWRLETPRGQLCLRRWPREHPTVERLQFIQAVLWHVRQEGFALAPVPLETTAHAGFVRHDAHLWELTPWMPGRADYATAPSDDRLRAAVRALARFHVAADTFPLPDRGPGPAPGLVERLAKARELESGGLDRLRRAVTTQRRLELDDLAIRLLELAPVALRRVLPLLARGIDARVPLQPCIRDIWHDHVLFEGDEVSGIVDFGALRAECVAADLARLLGSLACADTLAWQVGLAAYSAVRRLSPAEAQLVRAYDESGVLLAGMNWLTWVYVERREFSDWAAVADRIDANLSRLAQLVACGKAIG
jgi:Ser/Thr protein kinase RdoA (MazF antagonist)